MAAPKVDLFYGGAFHKASSATTFSSINPATGATLAEIRAAAPQDVDKAIDSAAEAFKTWSRTTPKDRTTVLLKAASLLRSRNDELATQESRDTGRPISETSAVDIVSAADVLEYYANLVASGGLDGETIQLPQGGAWVYTTKQPLGVCAGIGAFNYPMQIAVWKSAPCLAAGNTIVYKPSDFTPLHGPTLAEIFAEAGLPRGVFNLVQGGGEVGAYLASHPGIAKVSFTGSVSTGKKVAVAAAAGLKYSTMELGGKSPCLILPDADVDQAVNGAMMANFYSTGQVCTNGTRVFVPKSMLPAFEAKLLAKMHNVKPGDPLDPATTFGPLVSQVLHDKVLGFIKHGIEVDRAKLLHGGLDKPIAPAGMEKGFWVQPTVFSNCTDYMRIAREEIFGPVMAVLSYDTVEEAISRANDTTYGLAGGVFTRDVTLAHQVVSQLETGITWINTWGDSPAEMSVGGWKSSGLGVENGRQGLAAWTQNRSTLVNRSGTCVSVFAAPS